MPSFAIFGLPKLSLTPQQILDGSQKSSIQKSKLPMKEGAIPDKSELVDNCVYISFGFEYPLEWETLEGKKQDKALGEVPIMFLSQKFLAIGAVPDDIESKVREFLENNFIQGYKLEQIGFNESTLRKILETSPDVFQIDHNPTRSGLETVDRITYIGRGVTDSQIHEDYGSEPLAKIKVKLGEIEEARVGFDKRGIVTIYQRSFAHAIQALILCHITEHIIAPYLQQASFQKKLMLGE